MKKLISRVCCLCCVVLVLAACLPFSAFAVDPVSAGVMANAFAQAIAAYGASNGVAMTFDVTSTDGIGESVHELWKDFREGTQDADDYATLAAALFPDLYYKASSVVAGAADVYTVGYNISSSYAEEFDNFYNWLLSGPAEMVKVDNQYYEFEQSQIGPEAVPIPVYSFPSLLDSVLPYISSPAADANTFNSSYFLGLSSNGLSYYACNTNISSQPVYIFFTLNGSNLEGVVCSVGTGSKREISRNINKGTYNLSSNSALNQNFTFSGVSLHWTSTSSLSDYSGPYYSSINEGLQAVATAISDPSSAETDSIGVKAYDNTGVASFPDTTDPNYDAVAKQIPSTYPWNDSLYGDGTGALTDAQAGAIAGSVDDAIALDGVVDLAGTREGTDEPGTDVPPSDDPDDYVVPGLADIFPFCIPFDIYNFLSALAAAPVAPHFTATLDFPEAVGGTQTIDIDFDSPTWNQLAQLLRLLELLAFIIGLALLTRSMFIRG